MEEKKTTLCKLLEAKKAKFLTYVNSSNSKFVFIYWVKEAYAQPAKYGKWHRLFYGRVLVHHVKLDTLLEDQDNMGLKEF